MNLSHSSGLPFVFPFLFFGSGALGLVYEVLWMRRFTALFGGTTLATTATLSGFFLGLALGSAVFGERAKRWRRPLQAFGLLEIGVGAGALLLDPILDLYRLAYPALQPALAPYPLGFALVKLLLAMIAVGIPTFCMGGTLPALSEAVAVSGKGLGIPVGGLYAINLLGATAGTLAVPFVLLPRLGVDRSYWGAVASSLAIGLAAWAAGSGAGRPRDRATIAPEPARERTAGAGWGSVLGLSAVSGVCTLGLQVLWTRMFSLVHENSLYSFAVVVFVFLAGLAGGAALARAALRRGFDPRRVLGAAWLAAGLLVVVSPRLFAWMTGGLAYLPAGSGHASGGRLLALAVATMLPATLAMGTALPLLMELAGRQRPGSAGPVMGRLLLANTAGAILGPLLATFLLGPRLGLWWGLVALGLLAAGVGAQVGLRPGQRLAAGGILLVAVALIRPGAVPPVRVAEGERLVSVREGSYGTTAVVADEYDRWITVNNSYVLGGTAAGNEERWQAHLPLLLHPSPRRVAFLGLGTGITAGAAPLHPVEKIVALEIVPEVVAAAREDFATANAHLFRDPRLEVVTDDGRHYLAAPPHAFDVIVGDLLVPWRPAEAPLYSREHFESVRRALASDGLFCQWLPLYQLSGEQLAILARTFLDVFPRASLWRGNFLPGEPTLALVGHLSARPLDAAAIDERVGALAGRSGDPFLAHPAGAWLFLVGPLRPDLPGLAGGPRNTDSHPWVELLSRQGGGDWRSFVERVAAEPLEGSPLQALGAEHRTWRATGAQLSRASLDQSEKGKGAVLALLRTLPAQLQHALGVEAP
jgi:spermidine synthase